MPEYPEYVPFTFDYNVSGVTTKGETITDEGHASTNFEIESSDYYWDDGMLFVQAAETTLSHFYTMRIEKDGHQLAEATVTVKNLQCK